MIVLQVLFTRGEGMKKYDERSRKQIVIDAILEGGYTEEELLEIIEVCEEEINSINK